MAPAVAGTWRIVETDLWDRDSIDLVGPAFIEPTLNGATTVVPAAITIATVNATRRGHPSSLP